ncbi:MAG TPA: hypothetical protein VFW34_06900 [Candidatus Rubrimentiphilum sp.]|nr:hypothetical protein [Candidatus Rubrimentiphilum sp.]
METSQRSSEQQKLLRELAEKYFWWQEPGNAPRSNRRIIAQVMEFGDFDDVERAIDVLGIGAFAGVLRNALPGWLSPRSWAYWHYRCRLITPNQSPPPQPVRTL